jgi:hypothetical protein
VPSSKTTDPIEAGSTAVPVETAASAEKPAIAPEPVSPAIDELTVAENAVIGIRLETPVSSETSRVEDRVRARVTRDVLVDGRTAIPTGATLEGGVALVQSGGAFKERARIGIRFTTMVLADNTRVPIRTETIFRDGEAPGGEATAKIGASAVVGAILGAVVGGKKGAAIGGTAGAAGGTAVVAAGGANAAEIPAGTPLTVRLTAPVSMSVPRVEPYGSAPGAVPAQPPSYLVIPPLVALARDEPVQRKIQQGGTEQVPHLRQERHVAHDHDVGRLCAQHRSKPGR